jgi:5-methylcytosine-specific restriction endonuclease McrA
MNCLLCNKPFILKAHATLKIQKFCNTNCRYRFWCKKNRVREKEIRQKYRAKPEVIKQRREYNQKWYQSHLEHARKRNSKSAMRNRVRRTASSRKWRKTHPETFHQNRRMRDYRQKGALGTHTLEEWNQLKLKCNFTCKGCNRKEPEIKLTRDHIHPLFHNGTNYISNIQPLCLSCNARKNNKLNFEFSKN